MSQMKKKDEEGAMLVLFVFFLALIACLIVIAVYVAIVILILYCGYKLFKIWRKNILLFKYDYTINQHWLTLITKYNQNVFIDEYGQVMGSKIFNKELRYFYNNVLSPLGNSKSVTYQDVELLFLNRVSSQTKNYKKRSNIYLVILILYCITIVSVSPLIYRETCYYTKIVYHKVFNNKK